MPVTPDEFSVPDLPADWRDWSFERKANWLVGNARPRPTYGQACGILAKHAAARKRARIAAAMARQSRAERVTK